MIDKLVEQLKRDEGWVNTVYRDHLGYLTIGCGHNLDAKGLSDRAIEVILEDDIADVKAGVLGRWPWMRDLSAPRLGAFLNLAFNMGVAGLAGFRNTLKAAEEGRWEDVAAGVLGRWPWMRDLSAPRLGAFLNLAFNMGVAGLAGFRNTLKAAEEGRWEDVAAGVLDSKYATQVGDRARRVAQQLREDRWV